MQNAHVFNRHNHGANKMNPINTRNQTATTHVAVKPTNRKAKMLAKLNRYGKKLALGGAIQYK